MIVLFDKVCVNIDHAVMAQLTVIIITLTSKVIYITYHHKPVITLTGYINNCIDRIGVSSNLFRCPRSEIQGGAPHYAIASFEWELASGYVVIFTLW